MGITYDTRNDTIKDIQKLKVTVELDEKNKKLEISCDEGKCRRNIKHYKNMFLSSL